MTTTLYAVVYSMSQYAPPQCAGVYSDEKMANLVAKVNFGSAVVPVELDHIHPGHQSHLEALGYKL